MENITVRPRLDNLHTHTHTHTHTQTVSADVKHGEKNPIARN